MYNAGDFDTTETVNIPVNTFSSNDPTASVTATNFAAGDVEIHKDGSTTQRASDAGVTVTVNFDTVTGNHLISIDLSDNTDAGFYSAGSRYLVRVEGITVDAGTLNAWVGGFSIGCTLRPTMDGRTLDVTATGAAGIDWANVEGQTTAVDLSATAIDLCDEVTVNSDMRGTDSAALAATALTDATWTDARAGYLDELAAANIPADLDAVLADTNELQTDDTPTAVAAVQTTVDAIEVAVITNAAGVDISADVAAVKAETATILADTNELQGDWANGGRLDLIIDELTTQGDTNEGKIDTVDANVDSILTDTGTTLNDKIDVIDGIVDNILVDTGTTLQAELDGIQADTEDIQSRLPAALVSGRMSSDVEAINDSAAAADNLAASALGIVTGTVNDAAATSTSFVSDLTEATNDHYNGRIIVFTSGVTAGQATDITDYDGGTKTITMTALTEAPPNSGTFVIV